jgi:type II secretory ATPase GspE/PulE/Tfp pilus assembly ATPase PilB-like protein
MAVPIRLGDLLKEQGLITDAHIRYALQAQKVTREKLGTVLTRIGIVSEYDLASTVAAQLDLEYVNLNTVQPDSAVLRHFNRNLCLSLRIFPIRATDDRRLLIATSELPDLNLEQAVLRASGMKPLFCMAEESKVVSSIYNVFYFMENPVESLLRRETSILARDTSLTVNPDNFIHYLLLLAVKLRGTDVHLRPMADGISIAFRVDGVLRNELFLPRQLQRVITAIKLVAGMDISEHRLPQDGRWTANLLERRYDIRASSVVTPFGENIVLRMLSQEKASFSLANLGFLDQDLEILERVFEEPFGIVLLTGPTGSGKSTTLMAGLMSLDLLGKNVLTVENPIEYLVPLARQTEVNETAGYSFSNAMRHLLRHDPDIILVGEMRDEQTARTALTAATTGHLVLSTLHANTALGAIPRLHALGMDNLTMAESLVCVVSQRLVRTVCPACGTGYTPSTEELHYLGSEASTLVRGGKCEACNHTGYQGRTLVYEILVLDKDLRDMLEQDARLSEMQKTALDKGFRTMFAVGVHKVLQGLTTVEELQRVLGRSRY